MSTTGKTAWDRCTALGARLYRDRENGWIFGVCAGVAERYNFDVLIVRIASALSLLIFTLPTAVLYLAAALFIPTKPLIYTGSEREQEFWRSHADSNRWSSS